MLDTLRRSAGTWIVRIFLGVLILSFALWGVADVFTGTSSDVVAEVGDREITATDYQREFQLQLQQYRQRTGQQLSPAEARQMGIDGTVLSRLVGLLSLDEGTERIGLGASDEQVASAIRQDPAFKDAFGKFSRSTFERLLYQNGLTEAEYVDERRNAIARSQLIDATESGIEASSKLTQLLYRYENETRRASYFIVPMSAIGDVGEPDAETLNKVYDAVKGRYRVPERRSFTLVPLGPEEVAETITLSEDELRTEYEANKEYYDGTERRAVDQITFPSQEAADQARAEIADGESFEAVASAQGLSETDTDLGLVSRTEMLSPEIAEGAFALEEGGISQPIDGPLGPVIVRVRDIQAPDKAGFEASREQVRAELIAMRSSDEIFALYDAMEDARAGGQSLEDAANALNLPVERFEMLGQDGTDSDGNTPAVLETYPDLLATVFETGAGTEAPPGDGPEGGFYWVRVDKVEPARDRPLTEIRDEVVSLWRAQERSTQLQVKAADLAKAGNTGTPIGDLAAQVEAEPRTSPMMGRNYRDEVFSRIAVSNLFGVDKGKFAQGPVGFGDGMVVMQLEDVVVPEPTADDERMASLKNDVSETMKADTVASLVNSLQANTSIEVNEPLLQRLTSDDAQQGALF